jgi:hypothetical protein
MVSSTFQSLLERVAEGVAVGDAAHSLGLDCQRQIQVDAHYEGKPVCQVVLPWVVEGRAVLILDPSLPFEIAERRLQSLASSLEIPASLVYPKK